MKPIRLTQFQTALKIIQKKQLDTCLLPTSLYFKDKNRIYLKLENLQPAGSFKIRGATYAISKLPKGINEVVAYSTGNHAQAVALAAKEAGIKATIVMSPETLPFKITATQAYGAEVIIVPLSERQSFTEELAASRGAYLIPPFDHLDIITGQGTIGLEIMDRLTPEAVFVPVGGGGLIAGIANAIKEKIPSVKIIGVEPELENDATRSFALGKIVRMEGISESIADAVKIPQLGNLTFPLIQRYVDEMITVSERQIKEAMLMLVEQSHLVAEGSGALSLAGAMHYSASFSSNRPIVCIISGGNITLELLMDTNRREGRTG